MSSSYDSSSSESLHEFMWTRSFRHALRQETLSASRLQEPNLIKLVQLRISHAARWYMSHFGWFHFWNFAFAAAENTLRMAWKPRSQAWLARKCAICFASCLRVFPQLSQFQLFVAPSRSISWWHNVFFLGLFGLGCPCLSLFVRDSFTQVRTLAPHSTSQMVVRVRIASSCAALFCRA